MGLNFISFEQFKDFMCVNLPHKYITGIGIAYKEGTKQDKNGIEEINVGYVGYPLKHRFFKDGTSIPIKMQVLDLVEFEKEKYGYFNYFKIPDFFYVCIDNSFAENEVRSILEKNCFAYIKEDEAGGRYANTIYYFSIQKITKYFKNKNHNYHANLFITSIKNHRGRLTYSVSVAGRNNKGSFDYGKQFINTNTSVGELEDLLHEFYNDKLHCVYYFSSEELGATNFTLNLFTTKQMIDKLPGESEKMCVLTIISKNKWKVET